MLHVNPDRGRDVARHALRVVGEIGELRGIGQHQLVDIGVEHRLVAAQQLGAEIADQRRAPRIVLGRARQPDHACDAGGAGAAVVGTVIDQHAILCPHLARVVALPDGHEIRLVVGHGDGGKGGQAMISCRPSLASHAASR